MNHSRFMLLVTASLLMALLAGCAGAAPSAPAEAPAAPAETQPEAEAEAEAEAVNWLQLEDASQLPPTTVRYWYYETPERIELGQQQKDAFEAMYPNITVQGSTAPDAVDNEMLVAFIRAGTNSHVHQSVNNEDTWYFSRDLLLPLENLPGFDEVWERMNPNLNYTWKDGHVYSISWYSDPMLMFYNGQLVREAGLDPENPPETYSEFLEWAEALTGDNQWFISMSTGEEWWQWQFSAYPFYIAATGSNQLVSEDGKQAVFNTPAAVQSYELIETLFNEGYSLTEAMAGDTFLSGQVAATVDGAWLLGNVQRNAPEGFELIVGPIPKPDDSTVEGFPTYNFVRNFAILREQDLEGEAADQVNRAAWEFMKYLLSEEQMAADFAASGEFPPTKDLTENPIFTEILDQLPKGREVASYAENSYIFDMNSTFSSEIMGILTESYIEMVLGDMSPAEALEWAEEQANEQLAGGS